MMKKTLSILAAFLVSYSHVSAFCCSFLPEVAESGVGFGVAYRNDCFKSEFESCNFKTELDFKNINIWEIGLFGKYVTCNDVYFRGYVDYGWITSGKRTENDFIWDEVNCSWNLDDCFRHKVKGHVYDASLALGYQFRWCDDSFAFTPLVGYSWHGQHYDGNGHSDYYSCLDTCTDTHYTDCTCDEIVTLAKDHSSYSCSWDRSSEHHTRWNGPWLGFDIEYAIFCDWTILAGYEYHWAHYHAKNKLCTNNFFCFDYDGITSHQSARNAHGQRVFLGTTWDFNDCWGISLLGEYSWWRTNGGTDKFTVCEDTFNGEITECKIKRNLKDIHWRSGAIWLALNYIF